MAFVLNIGLFLYFLSAFAYIFGIVYYKMQSLAAVGVVCGTIISCLLGNYLYISFKLNRTVIMLVLSIEVFAYGIFIFLSGGFLSPYITYYLGCVLISLYPKSNYYFNILTICWCLICSFFGNSLTHFEQVKINVIVGVIIVIIGFAVLRYYLLILQEREKELEDLNEKLKTVLACLNNTYICSVSKGLCKKQKGTKKIDGHLCSVGCNNLYFHTFCIGSNTSKTCRKSI